MKRRGAVDACVRDLLAEAAKATFVPVGAENDRADKSDVRLNHNYADAEKRIGYSFARRNFRSDRAKTVYAAVGVDWWAEVYVNGRRVMPVSSGWKPKVFPLELRAGDNDVLVVTHGGSRQHWFTFYTNAAVEKFGAFEEFKPGAIKPKGHLESLLCRERDGMLGNRERLGYPFDTGLWSEPIRSIHFTEGVYNGEDEDVSGRKDWWDSGAWWPFEQTAYLLDAMARTATLVDAPKLAAEYRKSLDAVLKNQRASDGDLFVYLSRCTTQWPLAIFTRSAMAYADYTGDARVAPALARHYAGKKDVRTKWDGRDMSSLEGMFWTAEKTGDRALADDAVKAWENSGVRRRFEKETRIHDHGVSFSEALKMPALVYLYTGDRATLELGKRTVKNAFDLNEQASGQISCNEYLSGRDPRQGYESCVAADMTWTLGYYLQADGDVEAANRMERIVYNVLPGAITKDFCRHQYLSSANQAVCSPFGQSAHFNYGESAWRQYRPSHFPQCCTGNILRALPAFVQRMWMKDAKTGAPVAMLIGPCEVKGVYKGVGYTIAEETDYPFGDAVRFRVTVERPVEMPVRYRVPSWAERADAGSFATVTRTWKGTETFETTFPATVKLHSDRNWHWFTRGALTLSYAVPGDVLVERPGDRFSPIRVEPSGDWNFAFDLAALKGRSFAAEPRPSRDPYSEPAFAVRVPVAEIREWQVLDGQRFMPDPPLYAHPTGKTREIELVPYATTLARVTCFPDVTPRRQLPVVAAYTPGECYPFDEKKPLSEQVFAPEHWTDKQFRSLYKVPQRGRDLYFDFINFFGYGKPQLTYALFRIWSDADGEATFCIGAANRWQAFIDGKEVANSGDGWVEAEMMAPTWVRHSVKKGYNYLLLKVASPGCRIGQFRREWGAKVEVFME